MAGRIPQAFINSLIERVDIVSVIGARVELKRAGKSLKGLCPFHDEKTPSFNVNPDRQLYYCFGCGVGGTALTFLREYENLDFVESVEALAAVIGVEVPREHSREPPRDTGLYDILASADRTYREWLRRDPEAPRATGYLKQRGLTGEIARDFGIGYAPPGWDRLKTALGNLGESRLLDAGLLTRNDGGRVYDRFRDRIMFPIRDTRGRVVGFGGRVLGDEQPKYLNSPETDVFHKSRELYGLYEARRATRDLGAAIVVEGYMDVVALAQHGWQNAVATLGTAVGQSHFDRLYRYTETVVCCFDGDNAGRQAAWKAVLAAFPALSEGRQLRFALLPEGEDPDTIVRSRGKGGFERFVEGAVDVGDFFFGEMERGLDLGRMDVRARLCDLSLPHLATLPDGVFRRMMVERLADRAQVSPGELGNRIGAAPRPPRAAARGSSPRAQSTESPMARKLLHMLLREPRCGGELAPELRSSVVDAAMGSLLHRTLDYLADNPDADTAELVSRLVGDEDYEEVAGLAGQPLLIAPGSVAEEFRDGAARLVAEHGRSLRRAMLDGMGDSPERLREFWRARREAMH